MRVAYADPPYQGWSSYYKAHPDYDGEVDHAALIRRLADEFSPGWALSCKSNSLRELLPLCPETVRVAAWVKPFCSFKPQLRQQYAWEPVLFVPARTKREKGQDSARDFVSTPMSMRRGLVGVKPDGFCFWLFDLLGLEPGDELADLFPGSGAVTLAWEAWQRQQRLPLEAA